MEIQCEEIPVSIWTSDTIIWQCLLKQYSRKVHNLEDSEVTVWDSSNLNDNLTEKSPRFIALDDSRSVTSRKVLWKKMLVMEQAMSTLDCNREQVTGAPGYCALKDALGGYSSSIGGHDALGALGSYPSTTAGNDLRIDPLDTQCTLVSTRISFEESLGDLKSIPVPTSLQLPNIDDRHDPIIMDRVQDKLWRRLRRCSVHHLRQYRLLRDVYTTLPHKRQLVLSDQLQQWDQAKETGLLLGLHNASGNEAVIHEIDQPLHDSIISTLPNGTHPEHKSSISCSSCNSNDTTLNVAVNICAATDSNNSKKQNHTVISKSDPLKATLLDITSISKRAIQSINSRLGFRSNWFNLLDRLALGFGALLALLWAAAGGLGGHWGRRRRGKEGQGKGGQEGHGKEGQEGQCKEGQEDQVKEGKEGLYKQKSVDGKERREKCSPSKLLLLMMLLGFGSCVSACNQDACTNSFVNLKAANGISEGHNLPYCTLLRRYQACTSALSPTCRGDLKFHSHLRVINSLLTQHSCNSLKEDPSLAGSMDMRSDEDDAGGLLSGGSVDEWGGRRRDEPLDECDFAGPIKPRAHCGLFGDPHLRTFQGEFVTCRVLGAWPLLDTPDLAVQVTNQRVGEDLHATATTKVTAIIKGRDRCGPGRTYEASTDQLLPKAFVDGTSAGGGPDPARPAVYVKEVVSGQHIEIRIRYINATVSVRRIDKYLAVSATLPHAVAAAGEELGLCVTGCPPSEMLDAPITTAMPEEKALQLCSHYNLTDYFLDSCVFDLMTTGDSYFRQAAAAAQAELWTQDPIAAASTLRNCTQWPCQWQISAATTPACRAGLGSVILYSWLMLTVSMIVFDGL